MPAGTYADEINLIAQYRATDARGRASVVKTAVIEAKCAKVAEAG